MIWRSPPQILIAACLGWLAWGSFSFGWFQSSALLLPVLWSSAQSRVTAGLIVMAYTAAASRGLVLGAMEYFDAHLLYGLFLWLLANILPGLAGFICWHQSPLTRVFLIPVLLMMLIIPPVGFVGWAHPLTGAGWLMPGLGWLGLVLSVLLIMALAYKAPIRNGLFAIGPVLLLSAALSAPAKTVADWQGHNTSFHFGVGSSPIRNPLEEIERHWALQDQVSETDGGTHVFPETVGGLWNEQAQNEWQAFLKRQEKTNVLIGAHLPNQDGSYSNAVIQVTPKGSQIIYKQRLPIPFGMWRPWAIDTAKPTWLQQPGVSFISGKPVAFLICYEASLMWPMLHSLLAEPELLISMSSTWWAPASIQRSQHHTMTSWANLFSLPLVEAYNL